MRFMGRLFGFMSDGGRSSVGRAQDCGSCGRGFKSHRPPRSDKTAASQAQSCYEWIPPGSAAGYRMVIRAVECSHRLGRGFELQTLWGSSFRLCITACTGLAVWPFLSRAEWNRTPLLPENPRPRLSAPLTQAPGLLRAVMPRAARAT